MKFELFEYQIDAVRKTLKALRRATRDFEQDQVYSAVSLTAPTGAGKTAIATATIEALFFGDDELPGDSQATVLWLTDNPSLNEQTRRKMLTASTSLSASQLVTIEGLFDQEMLDAGKVYFLNIQKLAKNTTFVMRGTDSRRHSLWDTIANTIKARGGRFYVIIDEAHRGTGRASNDRSTILSRIISDPTGDLPATPVVWGISATPERFQEAMASANMPPRTQIPVIVPVSEVRESGLLKDTLNIRYPDDSQPSAMTLTALAGTRLQMMDKAWAEHAASTGDPVVKPVLVVQVAASVSDAFLGEVLQGLKNAWSDLTGRAVAHSFDSHSVLNVGGTSVRYLSPQDIEDDRDVRVVLFKEALTTGWDCPRVEVMVSFRKAEDHTYIAQLIGRTVRAPLARRITGNEALNGVHLFLPHYDKASVEVVVSKLIADQNSLPIEITANPVDCIINPELPGSAIHALRAVPTYSAPSKLHSSQIVRLHSIAKQLEDDGILENAVAAADQYLVDTMNRERVGLTSTGELTAMIADNGTIEVGVLTVALSSQTSESTAEKTSAHSRDIESLFKTAKRVFKDGLASRYWNWLLDEADRNGEDMHPDDAKTIVASMAAFPNVADAVELAAEGKVREWFSHYARQISDSSQLSREKYQQIRAQSSKAEPSEIVLSSSATVPSVEGATLWVKHVYAAGNGKYPALLNGWESDVVKKELAQDMTVGWYRNPTGGGRTVRIPYLDGTTMRSMHPDFVFLHSVDGEIKASIVDPHNYSLSDTGPKWQALAQYAANHGEALHRIDAVIKTPDGALLRLDLQDKTCREALVAAQNSAAAILGVFERHGGVY